MYLGIAGLLSFFLFFTLRIEIWLVITVFLGVFAAALAFLKYNGRPFEVFVINAALYIWKPKLYLWQRPDAKAQMPVMPKIPQMPAATGSKMKNLWLNLVTQRPTGVAPQSPAKTQTPIMTGGAPQAQAPIVHPVREGQESKSGVQILRSILGKKRDNNK